MGHGSHDVSKVCDIIIICNFFRFAFCKTAALIQVFLFQIFNHVIAKVVGNKGKILVFVAFRQIPNVINFESNFFCSIFFFAFF